MMLNPAIAAAERTETARHLIAQAQMEMVDLVALSALDLCVLDGPRQPLFEERVAHAWIQLGNRQRRKVVDEVTAGMVRRGLLIDDHPDPGTGQDGSTYSLQPELGLMLAARCRPAFIVIAAGERQGLRPLSLFALACLVRADGVEHNFPDKVPPIPPKGTAPSDEDRKEREEFYQRVLDSIERGLGHERDLSHYTAQSGGGA